MKRWTVLLLLVVVFPAVTFVAAERLQHTLGNAGLAFMQRHEQAWWALYWARPGATAAVVISTALLVGIAAAGWTAMRAPRLLPLLFVPGLRITLLSLVALISLHTALIFVVLVAAEALWLDAPFPLFSAFAGSAGIAGVVSMSRAALSALHTPSSQARCLPLRPVDHPELWRFVSAIAAAVGTSPPDWILSGLAPAFFATESALNCPEGPIQGRTLYLSIGACRILTKPELGAIIAHELAHLREADTARSLRFLPVYRSAAQSLRALAAHAGSWTQITVLPAYHLLSFFLDSFAKAEKSASRCQESACDQVSALVVGVENAGAALVKVTAFTNLWGDVLKEMRVGLALHHPIPNASLHYAAAVAESSPALCLRELDLLADPHPYDDHPPLSARLATLGITLAEVEPAARDVCPPDGAIWLFTAPERLEATLTDLENRALAAGLAAGIPAAAAS